MLGRLVKINDRKERSAVNLIAGVWQRLFIDKGQGKVEWLLLNKRQQIIMGNQPQTTSKFADQNQWLVVAQTTRKQLIQNKLSREIIEKHHLKNVEWNDVKQDSLIYQWRKDPKTAVCSVELFEIKKIQEEDEGHCLGVCSVPEKQTDLIVYTEQIHKLYEQNPKCSLSDQDQLIIFRGIIEGIDMLSLKFGEFLINKDMVGYNNYKRGKAWIHQNYCMNTVQTKRQVSSNEQRLKWQKEIINALIGICQLSSIDKSLKNCKFYFVMNYVQRNKLSSFASFRQFGDFKEINSQRLQRTSLQVKQAQVQKFSKDVQLSTSRRIRESNELISTEDKQKDKERQRVKIFNQTFDLPAHVLQIPDRDKTMLDPKLHSNTSYNNTLRPQADLKLAGKKRGPQPTAHRPHPDPYRPQQRIPTNETFLDDAVQYHRKHPSNRFLHPLYEIKEQPAHYALLDQLQESRSSRASSKMYDKEEIKMVDSWVVVEKRQGSDSSHFPFAHKGKNFVLEESIILRAPKK